MSSVRPSETLKKNTRICKMCLTKGGAVLIYAGHPADGISESENFKIQEKLLDKLKDL